MSDRALFAAFQKVKAQVDDAVSLSREREARARAEEEKARAAKKTRVVKAAETKKAEAGTASISASAFSATGGFGAALADAAKSSGASFRMAAPAKSRGVQPVTAPKVEPSAVRKHAQMSPSTKAKEAQGRRHDAKADRAGRRPSGEQARIRNERSEGAARQSGRTHSREGSDRQKTASSEAPKRRLSYEERRNPVPPFTLMPGLPVSERGEEVAKAIRENRVVIVCGETGSGKTTQLPKIAMMAGRGVHGMIAHTQPRRIAASSIAKRIAEELKTEPGEVVGYKVRFTDTMSPGATIKLMTDGILLAETQNDPMLRAYDTVIIDEAHERSINIDFLLGYLKRLLSKRRDLKVIVTSATIDAERFARHFEIDGRPAPILTISGRTYPVEVRYRPIEDMDEADDKTLIGAIDDAVGELEASGRGDILVFLPGEREIREAADVLRKSRPSTTEILPLFARLTAAEQERVFRPAGTRRIVLSTNVAETSITVPGIRFVVDTGLARVKRYSYRNKVEQLQIEPVSQASANQRAGRCGRVADGICIRLYSEEDFARRPAFTDPEILRSNLAAVILRAISLKLGDVREFPFVQTPPPRAIADGFAILQELNAVTEEGELTRVGRELARLPVDPRLGRMLLAGSEQGSLEELLTICAGLSIQDPRERPADAQQAADEAHRKLADEKSDFLSYVKLWNWYEKANAEKESNRKLEAELHRRYLSVRRLREWRDVRRQLVQLTDELGWRRNTSPATFEQVHRTLLTGLLGNIGSKAVESDFRAPPYLGARGIKFWIWPGSARAKKAGRWILAAEIVETSRMFARCVADIEPEWIEAAAGDLLRRNWTEPHWEKSRGEVVAFERGTLYGLTIYQQRRVSFAPHDPKLARELFIRQGFRRNLIINTRCAGAIGATGRQTAVEQVRPTTQGVLKDLVPFPLIVIQLLPDNDFQPFIHQFGVEDAVLVGHLRGNRDSCRADDPHGLIPYLHLHPCGQLVLFFEGLLQFALHLRPGVIVIQSGQERRQLPRVVLNSIQMVLVLVVAGVVGGGALDFFIQFLFQLLIVLFCAPDVPVLSGVHGLPGHLCAAGKEDTARGKARHHHQNEQNKNAHDHQNVCVAFGGIHQPLYGGADGSFAFLHRLFHAGPCGRCTVGCRFTACGLCRCT